MHWSFKLAEDVIARYPNKEEYVVASGISPSGSVHIGNYREFITNYYVGKALKIMGKKVRMIFSWDEFDRMRKVPKNIAQMKTGYEKYIGMPYSLIPDPNDKEENYAKFYEKEFEAALARLSMNEIPVKFIYQAAEYKSKRYNKNIVYALSKRKEIYDIITSFKTEKDNPAEDEEGKREEYYPVSIYCETCGHDFTKVIGANADFTELTYECKCGERHTVNVLEATNIKLVWKVDWPMRWREEGVNFEAAGIDHHSAGGSYEVATKIAKEIFGIEAPVSVCFAWVGIRGISSGSMHSSTGVNITPAQLLGVYEPEMLRWLYAKYYVGDSFDFGFDDTIIRHYGEFDRGVSAYLSGEPMEEFEKSVYDLCLIETRKTVNPVSFGTMATVAPISGFNIKLCAKTLGLDANDPNFIARFNSVKYWLENYAPEKIYKLLPSFNKEFYLTISDEEKSVLARLAEFLNNARTEKEIQEFLYSLINIEGLTKKENQVRQQRFFKVFYNMLFGRDDGPRLYLFLSASQKDDYLKLLAEHK
ncbi:MAG: lysine--tRNA ligase [Christensenellaceae bacterium]|jgi:lysyl-tRNA synthetase class 1|nr:lysine--tRNA ligase [Christensenellaceae bacterium]